MKKFLSLLMALVMTMSLVTVSAGAVTYSDDSKVTYKEAVDVVSACGIVEGFPDGSFAPTDTLTRAQAAKIICVMLMGPDAAATLSADTAPFTDVPASHWAAGYIAHCVQEDIIAGKGDGTFGPDDELTGFAFMKMLLCALGYDATFEEMVGANWSISVAKLVSDCDLDDDVDNFVGKNVVTREEACQYVLNTLKATMVEYDNNVSTITVGNTTIINNAKAEDKEWSKNSKDDGTIDGDGLVQFAEKYFEDLECKTKNDDLGRPGTEWTYDGTKIGTYGDTCDDSMVIIKSLDAQQILVTDSDFFDYDKEDFAWYDADDNETKEIAVWINGKKTTTDYDGLKNIALYAGDEVELFEIDDSDNVNDGRVNTVVVTRYSLAVIDEIDEDLSSTYTKKGASYGITLENLDETSLGGTYYDVYEDHDDEVLVGFSADEYVEGAVIAVALSYKDSDVVLASHLAETVTGTISSYNNGSKAKIVLGGETYQLHKELSTTKDTGVDCRTGLSLSLNDDDYTAYLDKNGYVIGIETDDAGTIDDVYYVTGIIRDTSRATSYYAQAVALEDGTVTLYRLNTDYDMEINGEDEDITELSYTSNFAPVSGLYTFEKSDGKYYAEVYEGDSTYDVTDLGTINDDLARDDSSMRIAGTKVYLDEDTNYVKVEDVGEDIEVKYVTGGTSVKKSGVTAVAVYTESKGNKEAAYVVLISWDFSNASSDDVLFVVEKSSTQTTYTDSDGDNQKAYMTEVIFLDGSGVHETIMIDGSAKAKGFYTYSINDDDVYEVEDDSVDSKLVVSAANGEYDDETGYVTNVLLTGIHGDTLTGEDQDSNIYFEDVEISEDVVIDDDRGKAARDADYYTNSITTVSQLKSAIEKNGGDSGLIATLYVDDEQVVMIHILSMAGKND